MHPILEGESIARRIVLCGRVQGLGVRPAIARLAAMYDLTGTVSNRLDGVEIVVEGSAGSVDGFVEQVVGTLPAAARVDRMSCEDRRVAGYKSFDIDQHLNSGRVAAEVPRDMAVCPECLTDVSSSANRRVGYPFTSCTRCGPRYSLIERMPFERSLTGMFGFSLCVRCRREYTDPRDRRFHSQTNCCPDCGPHVWSVDSTGRILAEQDAAIDSVAQSILRGEIAAIRGVGGYQLLCDATSARAVQQLRERKRREAKPFAVMVDSIEMAAQVALIGSEERTALTSPANPIVLVTAHRDSLIVAGVHPGLAEVGLMLPTTPLHWLIARKLNKPFVVTSGNREGDPLTFEVDDSERILASIVDLWLHHDRPIQHPIDDSVVRIAAGRQISIRCARGLAPLPLPIETSVPILAVGGHQKSAIALSNGGQSVLGPHLGELDGLCMQRRFAEHVEQMVSLYGERPQWIAHDLHPQYFSTGWAQDQDVPMLGVQHHHAHVVAGMLEHGWLDREVIGVAFDGTGYGTEGAIWGGEFLLATVTDFRRIAGLHPFPLPGGEAAIHEPWRVAVSLVAEASSHDAASRLHWPSRDADSVRAVLAIRNNRKFSPVSTSAGRLFDGVAALALGVDRSAYEGQGAMLLEAACDHSATGEYVIPLREAEIFELDWRPMVCQILADRSAGISGAAIAMRFHRGLASAIASVARRFAPRAVVLSGGTFQNRILTELVVGRMANAGQSLGLPGRIPPNDGGLAAGQLAVAAARIRAGRI